MSSTMINYGLSILFLVLLSAKFSSLIPIPLLPSQSNHTIQCTESNQSLPESNITQEDFSLTSSCQCQQRNDSQSCTSLVDAISDLYARADPDKDVPYHFFSLKDLFYSAILGGLGGNLEPPPLNSDLTEQPEKDLTTRRCSNLKGRYNLPTSDTENCKWIYECTQNQHQFPSFHVDAKLSNCSSTSNCAAITMKDRRFVRTTCASNNTLPHWQECDCGTVVVGFKHTGNQNYS